MNQPCFITLLAGLQVQQGDRVISRFRTQKTAALLAYLAYFLKRSHPREELCELLWPDTDPQDSRASLRMALSSLRRQLEPPGTPYNSVLVADRLNVRLNPQAVSTDAARFEAALQVADRLEETAGRVQALMQALEIYRGPLLPGFYEEWALRERERLEQMYIAALGQLTEVLEQRGELGQAIEYARRRVHADPLMDEAHCDLIRLYITAGQMDAARAQYEELERVFRAELGVAPSSAAQVLAARLSGVRRKDTAARAATVSPSLVRVASPAPVPLPSWSAPPVIPPLSPHLPLYLTPFFGREDEMAQMQSLLSRGLDSAKRKAGGVESRDSAHSRLVTLTGPGGSGKTRLAVEAIREMTDAYGGRIWFVPLADIADAALILDSLLIALGLPHSANQEPLEQIAQTLDRQPSLLLLDNFEQLVEAGAPIVWTLLERSPTLTCLLTSRQRLDLAGEREIPVQPLLVPTVPGTPERLVEFPSVRLFVDRAQTALPDFQITRENAAAVAALCARLEGIPLAIELAAAWAAVLTPSQMLARLEERFTFLASKRKGLHARQRSLRDTIEWSYRLLKPELQHFFTRLSVFRGGWALEAAEAVAGISGVMEYGSDEPTLHLLAELRAHSLVVVEEMGDKMRFRLLETLREYAWDRLMESREGETVRERHRDYFLGLAEEANPRLQGPEQAAALALLEAEHDNLRAALRYSVESRGESPPPGEAGPRLGVAMCPFWEVRGYLSEGRKWLEALLAGSGSASVFWRAKALNAAGTLAWQQASYAQARAFFGESLALYRQCGDKQGIADALHGLGIVAEEPGDYAAARAFLEESLAIKRELGDRRGLAASLNTLANVVTGQGDYATARALHEKSLTLKRELEDKLGISISLNNLAIVAYEQGDYAEARTLLEETLMIKRELGDQRGIGICLNNLGELAWREGESMMARSLHEEALAIRRQLEDKQGVGSSLAQLANLAADQGDHASARSLYADSLAIRSELEDKPGIVECLEKIARLAIAQGQPGQAAQLFGAAERLRETIDAPLPPIEQATYDSAVMALQTQMEKAVFTVAWQDGRAMTLEQAVEYALKPDAMRVRQRGAAEREAVQRPFGEW